MMIDTETSRLRIQLINPAANQVTNLQVTDTLPVGVVIAAEGYPGSVRNGDAIDLPHDGDTEASKLFHAGTRLDGGDVNQGRVVTAGGRVFCACGLGDSVAEAAKKAYELAGCVRFDGAFLRRDIGYRAIAREASVSG